MFSVQPGKPGSVYDNHLSRICVSTDLKPSPKARGPRLPSTTLLRVGFTRPSCLHSAGELLPRLFILTPPKRAVFFSVALSLKSPSPGVTRHPCPVKPGLSSRTGFRTACARDCLGLPGKHTYYKYNPVQITEADSLLLFTMNLI